MNRRENPSDLDRIRKDIIERDERDDEPRNLPLKQAEDAVRLIFRNGIDDVVNTILITVYKEKVYEMTDNCL